MTFYLDHNATTPARPGVTEAVAEALAVGGNPSSVHAAGRRARRMVEDARESVAALAAARPEDVVFTSGGTEASQLALGGFPDRRVAVSAVEHDAVRNARADADILPVDRDGRVDLGALDGWLASVEGPALVSVMAANNETGVLQPVGAVADRVHAAAGLLHCDAVQAVGKLNDPPAEFDWRAADMVSVSAHKIGGPAGVGALVLRHRAAALIAAQRGGGQERGRRGGTENLPGIVGFGVAAMAAREDDDWLETVLRLRDGLEARLASTWGDAVSVIGASVPRLANTSCFAVPGLAADTQVMALDLAGVAVSAGSACSSGKVKASHVLRGMGYGPELAGSAIRVSLGWNSEPADIDAFLAAWDALLRRRGRPADQAA